VTFVFTFKIHTERYFFMEFITKEKSSEEDINVVRNMVSEYNRPYFEQSDLNKVVIEAWNESEYSGGIVFFAAGESLNIEMLWVNGRKRGSGLGSELLKKAEEHGRRSGCNSVYLTTFNFQSRPFYEKHGYKVVYTQRNFSSGIEKYHMEKELR
jgi:GNAT superfamily N-acetyltransferase